jgi:hypothetical protein
MRLPPLPSSSSADFIALNGGLVEFHCRSQGLGGVGSQEETLQMLACVSHLTRTTTQSELGRRL